MPLLALLIGCLACSTSVIWIKLSNVEPVLLTGLRLAIATIALAPFAWRDWREHRERLDWSHVRYVVLPGVVLAVHFMTWIYGARLTYAANGSLIVNLTPLATPFLLAALSGEWLTGREVLATAVASGGLAILFVADYQLSPETLFGDLVCFVGMLLVAIYLVLGRRFRHHPTTLLYVTPVYAIAALIALAVAPFTATDESLDWGSEWFPVVMLALLPTIVGHSLLNQAMRRMRGQVVSIVNMSQFIFAGAMAWRIFDEQPEPVFYVAAALVVTAGVLVTTPGKRKLESP